MNEIEKEIAEIRASIEKQKRQIFWMCLILLALVVFTFVAF